MILIEKVREKIKEYQNDGRNYHARSQYVIDSTFINIINTIIKKYDSGAKLKSHEIRFMLKLDWSWIEHIEKPSNSLLKEVIKHSAHSLEYMNNPPKEIQDYAIRRNSYALKYIDNPTDDQIIMALRKQGELIKNIKEPTNEMLKTAIRQNPFVIRHINKPSRELILMAVKLDGACIEHVAKQDSEIQNVAIASNIIAAFKISKFRPGVLEKNKHKILDRLLRVCYDEYHYDGVVLKIIETIHKSGTFWPELITLFEHVVYTTNIGLNE